MTDIKFIQDTYEKIKKAIFQIDNEIVPEIYILSFYVHNDDDDPRQPMLTVGYNTIERWHSCSPTPGQEPKWPIASDGDEAKWNFAFWLQNEALIIGGYDFDPVSEWVKNTPYYYSDEQVEDDFDTTDLMGQKIKDKFIEIVISHARKLHSDGVITVKFGKDIPIIVHELEYYDKPVLWTNQANPDGLAKEFENWVASF
ncbi:hypothetical protein [Flavihumibacter sp. UBA7668]|uniref:hypothetical protein n=1 Tax=Flavihumibacter sp. UBA7668 TaxID=1946542 RepID=UPI0025C255A3|nr:hypothetical protein [Flavihumibacter sp. UBA7668]